MRTNPFWDVLKFLFEAKWTTGVFWALLVASAAIAAVAYRRDPTQRTLPHLWTFVSRLTIGAMWWQQSLWKIPPTYTDRPDGSGGLRYWVEEMAKYAAFGVVPQVLPAVVEDLPIPTERIEQQRGTDERREVCGDDRAPRAFERVINC